MDTESGIKLIKELKQNKLLPRFNVSQIVFVHNIFGF